MALFFDQEWFDAMLSAKGANREDIGRLLQLTADQVAELWKDQRELKAPEVLAISRFLNVPAEEIALRAGISTPAPKAAENVKSRVGALEDRVMRLEGVISELQSALQRLSR